MEEAECKGLEPAGHIGIQLGGAGYNDSAVDVESVGLEELSVSFGGGKVPWAEGLAVEASTVHGGNERGVNF